MRIIERFPAWLRFTHWMNVFLLTGMIWSGILIYWANRVYTPFLPDSFYVFLGLDHRLAEGLWWHFAIAPLFAVNGLAYGTGLAITGEWKSLVPRLADFRGAWRVLLHDLGIRREKPVQGKLNSAQKFAYTGVIAMGAGSLITGLAVAKPKTLWWLAGAMGGYEAARWLHFALTVSYLAFIVVHLAQVARAGYGALRSMVAGFEEETEAS